MKPGKALIRTFLVFTGAAMTGLWAMKPSTAFEAVPPKQVFRTEPTDRSRRSPLSDHTLPYLMRAATRLTHSRLGGTS